ncbi:MAG: hypothetical protein P4L69_15595 [Desulfosporosinus sp.]|nr:hypothetical protein [Desulfosporosinus sp.]
MDSWIDDGKTKWGELSDTDKFVVGSAATLTIGGAILALVTGRASIFAAGAGISATLIVVRLATKGGNDDQVGSSRFVPATRSPLAGKRSAGLEPRRSVDFTYGGGELGAPVGRMEDNGPVQTFNGLPTLEDAKNFPMMHRIPEVDVRTEPLDDRIRYANTSPLGPYTGQTVTGFW